MGGPDSNGSCRRIPAGGRSAGVWPGWGLGGTEIPLPRRPGRIRQQAIGKLTTTFSRIVVDKSDELAECARVIEVLAQHVPVVVFTNDHDAGFAAETARALHRLLGIPEPIPPPGPGTTLFD